MSDNMKWTTDKEQLLAKLWGEGKTGTQAARLIGGVTRSAVIAKVHRLNLPTREGKTNRPWSVWEMNKLRGLVTEGYTNKEICGVLSRNQGAVSGKICAMGLAGLRKTDRPNIKLDMLRGVCKTKNKPKMLPLNELKQSQCHWPVGDAGSKGFGFCGHKAADRMPYCAEHHVIAHRRKETL